MQVPFSADPIILNLSWCLNRNFLLFGPKGNSERLYLLPLRKTSWQQTMNSGL